MRPKHLEISKASFMEYVNDLKNYAKKYTDKKILLITLGASHGFLTQGFQTLTANRYSQEYDYYEQIEVEKNTRNASEECPNLYTLTYYAACRGVIRESDDCFRLIRKVDQPKPVDFLSQKESI